MIPYKLLEMIIHIPQMLLKIQLLLGYRIAIQYTTILVVVMH